MTTLDDLLLKLIAEHGFKKRTQQHYRQTLAALASALRHELTIDDLKMDSIDGLARVLNEKGLKPFMVNKLITKIVALWNFAFDLRLCQWPAPSPCPRFDPRATV